MHDIVARVPGAQLHRSRAASSCLRVPAQQRRRRVRELPLPQSADERAWLFLLARPHQTGDVTRRTEWFVTKSPEVYVDGQLMNYMISFALPRFTDQTLSRSRKRSLYPDGTPDWVAKLDTVMHELYHIDPEQNCLRRFSRADGAVLRRAAQPDLFRRRRGAGAAVPGDAARSSAARIPAVRFRRPARALRRRCRRRRSGRSRRTRAAIAKRWPTSRCRPNLQSRRSSSIVDPVGQGFRRRRPAAARVHWARLAVIEQLTADIAAQSLRDAGLTRRVTSSPARAPTNRSAQYWRAQMFDADDAARARRVDELIAANGDPDVRRAAARRS